LYVAVTRARHTLILALDAGFFRGKRGVHTDTQLKWLQADVNEPNADIILDLSDEATACEQTAARHKDRAPELIGDSLLALRLETGWVDIARQRAASILETVTPSQFAPEEELSRSPSVEEWIELEPESGRQVRHPPGASPPAKGGLLGAALDTDRRAWQRRNLFHRHRPGRDVR